MYAQQASSSTENECRLVKAGKPRRYPKIAQGSSAWTSAPSHKDPQCPNSGTSITKPNNDKLVVSNSHAHGALGQGWQWIAA